jgi:phytoene/squalene synthetase
MIQENSAALAQSITREGSKQAYYTARLMVDKDLVNDFNRAYAYFRWMDDIVDDASQSHEKRIAFIRRQKELVDRLYRKERMPDLTSEEQIIADLISHDRYEDSWLQSYIRNMFAIVEFDTYRQGQLISEQELNWYTERLGESVTDGIQYFIGNGYPYPVNDTRCLAARAAHITHLLRDMVQDMNDGIINIPKEYLEAHDISPQDINSPVFRNWVRNRVDLARSMFLDGKRYLDELGVLRCKVVGRWYCARFEVVLDTIERDNYALRSNYNERKNMLTWLKIARLGISVTLRHLSRKSFLTIGGTNGEARQ